MSSFASTSLAFGEEDAITETLMESDKKPSAVKKTERAILQALKADVDALAKQFLSGTDLDLHRFVELFNEMEFPTIFLGQFSYSDLVEVWLKFLLKLTRHKHENFRFSIASRPFG